MSTGHTVETEDLRRYAGKLASGPAKVNEIKGLVATADVGGESWGVVGLFVYDQYAGLLDDLNEVLNAMREGYESAADKFNSAAEGYESYEEDVLGLLNGLQVEIANASTSPRA